MSSGRAPTSAGTLMFNREERKEEGEGEGGKKEEGGKRRKGEGIRREERGAGREGGRRDGERDERRCRQIDIESLKTYIYLPPPFSLIRRCVHC